MQDLFYRTKIFCKSALPGGEGEECMLTNGDILYHTLRAAG